MCGSATLPVSNWKFALFVGIRSDLTYAASNLARFYNANQATLDYSETCIGYSDADWAGYLDNRRSTSGYLFQISGGAVTSKSKNCYVLHCPLQKQNTTGKCSSRSYLDEATATEFGYTLTKTTTIYEDNQEAISMNKNP